MAPLNPHHRRRKQLMTYSRKVTRLLPLDGAQFLREPSIFSNTPSRALSDNQDDHQSGLDGVDQTTNDALSSASYPSPSSSNSTSLVQTPVSNLSSLVQTPVSRPRPHLLYSPMVSEEDLDPNISASPLSESAYDDHDSIVDDQRLKHSVKPTKHEHTHTPRAPHVPLTVVRKALKLPETHRTACRPKSLPTRTEADRLAILQGSDGFTLSELFWSLGSRRKKARASHFSRTVAILDVQKGLLPDVQFSTTTSTHDKLCLASNVESDKAQDGTSVFSTTAGTRQKPLSNDMLVYAQLSSIHAPRQESPVELSDDSENEDYQDELLGSVQSFSDHEDPETVSRTTSASNYNRDEVDKERVPGQLPSQPLNDSEWIGVDEEILDDEPAVQISRFRSATTQPVHSKPVISIRTNTLVSANDGRYFDMAQRSLRAPRSNGTIACVESDKRPTSPTKKDKNLHSDRPDFILW